MKSKEIRELSVDDLKTKSKDLAEELNKLKFQHGIRPLENTAKLKDLRRQISRVKTVITEKLQSN
ncbi:MAG: 50S ribosomal protein L29 [Proteobacteria bacterium]|nr:50S ribosomal protein L29 [Pseudomonadota bacterium]MCG2746257.1 50S ribosomal protein L29 [Desulfobulbaceae bacterium]